MELDLKILIWFDFKMLNNNYLNIFYWLYKGIKIINEKKIKTILLFENNIDKKITNVSKRLRSKIREVLRKKDKMNKS